MLGGATPSVNSYNAFLKLCSLVLWKDILDALNQWIRANHLMLITWLDYLISFVVIIVQTLLSRDPDQTVSLSGGSSRLWIWPSSWHLECGLLGESSWRQKFLEENLAMFRLQALVLDSDLMLRSKLFCCVFACSHYFFKCWFHVISESE